MWKDPPGKQGQAGPGASPHPGQQGADQARQREIAAAHRDAAVAGPGHRPVVQRGLAGLLAVGGRQRHAVDRRVKVVHRHVALAGPTEPGWLLVFTPRLDARHPKLRGGAAFTRATASGGGGDGGAARRSLVCRQEDKGKIRK
jgi:hypothetical protein